MSEPLTPALTPEEWNHENTYVERDGFYVYAPPGIIGPVAGSVELGQGVSLAEVQHATAALCLYEQPFGFTQEDIALLRRYHADCGQCDWEESAMCDLANRIAALLPPVVSHA